jgi:hypothetical protein
LNKSIAKPFEDGTFGGRAYYDPAGKEKSSSNSAITLNTIHRLQGFSVASLITDCWLARDDLKSGEGTLCH